MSREAPLRCRGVLVSCSKALKRQAKMWRKGGAQPAPGSAKPPGVLECDGMEKDGWERAKAMQKTARLLAYTAVIHTHP